jgi:hypothetical protein
MKNYEDINVTFRGCKKTGSNVYLLEEKRIYEPIGKKLYRINEGSSLDIFGFEGIIDMENQDGRFVPEWESTIEIYEEQTTKELREFSFYGTLKKAFKFSTGLIKIILKGNDKDVFNFLDK